MTVTPLEALSWARIALVLSVLVGASIRDVRTRTVPDRFWIVLLGASSVLIAAEIIIREPDRLVLTLLSLSMPALGMVFMLWGYPEIGKALKGARLDIIFSLVYLALIGGSILSYLLGDRAIAGKMLLSLVFMGIYFAMYTYPMFGARLIHGGADAKCLMTLAVVFPWYGEDVGISFGPFYEMLSRIPFLEYMSPVHLGVLINGALMTVALLGVMLPLKNLLAGTFHPLRSWTSYWMATKDLQGSHVWVISDDSTGGDRKRDPSPELIDGLRRRGINRVRVTPKVPFILSLTLGFVVQILVGNAILALMFLL